MTGVYRPRPRFPTTDTGIVTTTDNDDDEPETEEDKKQKEAEANVLEVSDDPAFEFDFLDWLDEQNGVQQKMKRFQSEYANPDDIPWPEVDEINPNGKISIVYALPVFYKTCDSCFETRAEQTEQQ